MLHAAGWLEGGLAIGYEKFVLDCDQLGMMATFVQGLDMSDNGQAVEAIIEHEPGHPLPRDCAHARQLRDRVLPLVDGRQLVYEQWFEEGSLDAAQRANKVWKEQLAAYEPPPLDDAIDEELPRVRRRRKAVLPDSFA